MRFLRVFLTSATSLLTSLAPINSGRAQSAAPMAIDNGLSPSTLTLTTLATFGDNNGQYPTGPLAQGVDGNFYGTTLYVAVVYKMTPAGQITVLHNSCTELDCAGDQPYGGVTLTGEGSLYGTTSEGGNGAYSTRSKGGTIFSISPQDKLNTLYSFCSLVGCEDGVAPITPLAEGTDGNLYGTTPGGGAYGKGTVFKITPQGALTTLHSFCAQTNCPDGSSPYGGMVQGSDGSLYGTTIAGGTSTYCGATGCGTVFKIDALGTLTTLHSFCSQANCTDGSQPEGSLVEGADGNFYGATQYGYTPQTTLFKITPQGVLTTFYTFCSLANCADGYEPGSILQASDGNFYGATQAGGGTTCEFYAYGCGTIFKITAAGALTTLYRFCPQGGSTCPDGEGPDSLRQGTDGKFYGATFRGGTNGLGTAFSFATGLRPFIMTATTSGQVGSAVIILGNNLTSATRVTFNGVSAAFTVVSSSELRTTVPAGATTGSVKVTTRNGTLKSNKTFHVAG